MTSTPSDRLPLRLAILMEHPSPHMVALLDALSRRRDCIVEVVYCQRGAPDRDWGSPMGNLRYRVLPGFTLPLGLRINSGIGHAIRSIRADAWILNCVYNWPTTVISARLLQAAGIPFAYMGEPPRPRGRRLDSLKQIPLRHLLRGAAGIIGMGQEAERRYRVLTSDNRPTTSVPYFVELQSFLQLEASSDSTQTDLQFLTACQLIPRKGLDLLISACRLLPKSGWQLTIVGQGPLRDELREAVGASGLEERIRLTGAAPYAKRHTAFSGKDIFVFPSRWDGWGMVVPEALAAGLPVISTTAVMSAVDFIRDGANGLLIPPESPQALANAMKWFFNNRSAIPAMSRAARNSVSEYSACDGASKLVNFMSELRALRQCATSNSPVRASAPLWHELRLSSETRASARLRALAKRAVIHAATGSGLRRRPGGHAIVFYHVVLREDRNRFDQHLQFFRDNFEVTSVGRLVAAASAGEDTKFRLAITFDDGFRVLMQDCLELLQKHSIPATFYVPTGFIEAGQIGQDWRSFSLRSFCYDIPLEPMKPSDLKLLVQLGHEVQSHGVSHSACTALTSTAFRNELKKSHEQINRWTGIPPDSFAYPYGSVDGAPYFREILEETGYSLAVTAARGRVTRNVPMHLVPRDHAEGNWNVRDLRYFLFA